MRGLGSVLRLEIARIKRTTTRGLSYGFLLKLNPDYCDVTNNFYISGFFIKEAVFYWFLFFDLLFFELWSLLNYQYVNNYCFVVDVWLFVFLWSMYFYNYGFCCLLV